MQLMKKFIKQHTFHCDEFINNLPEKYETLIGEDAEIIWRRETKNFDSKSYVKKSPIILLDEATSSLDSETEAKYKMH